MVGSEELGTGRSDGNVGELGDEGVPESDEEMRPVQMSRWCRADPLASIRQMSRQVSRGSAGEYQADEQAGVARLRWRVSGR